MSDAPICPHCGAKRDDPWELDLDVDGDETILDCHACNQDYYITLRVKHTYATRPRTELDETREGLARSRFRELFLRQRLYGLDAADVCRDNTEELERRVRELESTDV